MSGLRYSYLVLFCKGALQKYGSFAGKPYKFTCCDPIIHFVIHCSFFVLVIKGATTACTALQVCACMYTLVRAPYTHPRTHTDTHHCMHRLSGVGLFVYPCSRTIHLLTHIHRHTPPRAPPFRRVSTCIHL